VICAVECKRRFRPRLLMPSKCRSLETVFETTPKIPCGSDPSETRCQQGSLPITLCYLSRKCMTIQPIDSLTNWHIQVTMESSSSRIRFR
jgi:hypothetical protein